MKFLMEDVIEDFLTGSPDAQNYLTEEFVSRLETAFEREGFRGSERNNPPNILVIRLDGIGDNVLNSGFLRELRRNHPLARITLIVTPVVRPLVELCPYVNEVLSITFEQDVRRWLTDALKLCREKLWRARFDACFMPRWDTDAYFGLPLGFLSGAKMRASYSEQVNPLKMRANAGFDRFLTDKIVAPPSIVHESERNLFFLRALGLAVHDDRNEVWFSHADRKRALELTKNFFDGRSAITIADGGNQRGKHYPPELFVQALKKIALKNNCRFVNVGGEAEFEVGEYFRSELGEDKMLNLAGRTTLRETCAVIERTSVYIGTDTSTLHMAAALAKPIITLNREGRDVSLGYMSFAARFAPWRTFSIMLRPENSLEPCRTHPSPAGCSIFDRPHCIAQITPDEIVAAYDEILNQ